MYGISYKGLLLLIRFISHVVTLRSLGAQTGGDGGGARGGFALRRLRAFALRRRRRGDDGGRERSRIEKFRCLGQLRSDVSSAHVHSVQR